ncbi:MAG TPA: GNAT family N-acetyltransferase [Streptosporangiaceae bacterium]|jgi:GNAT superfamily N-acetyltransferase
MQATVLGCEYSLVQVETLSREAVAGVRRIYEDGFPPHQRADFAEIIDRRQDREFALALVRRDRSGGGQPCGFAMLRPLGDTGWVFLRYFVVDHRQRGQGLGGLLWDHLTARLRADGFTLLVFDVDDPAEPGHGPDEVSVRSRRIGFYQRHGASVLPVTGYRTPHVCADHADPDWTPMLLITARLAETEDGPDRDDGWARAVVDAVYRYRWRLDPRDPELAESLIISQ